MSSIKACILTTESVAHLHAMEKPFLGVVQFARIEHARAVQAMLMALETIMLDNPCEHGSERIGKAWGALDAAIAAAGVTCVVRFISTGRFMRDGDTIITIAQKLDADAYLFNMESDTELLFFGA